MRTWFRCVLVVLALALPSTTFAQNGGDVELSFFRPAMDSRGYITVNASQVLGHNEFSFGLVTNWGRGLLRLENGDNEYVVSDIITPTLIGAYGLKLGPVELEFGLSLPLVVMSGDRDPNSDGGTPDDPRDDERFGFEGQGIGDVGAHLKVRFLSTSKGPKIGLALVGSIYFPSHNEDNAWQGEDGVTPQAMLVVDKEIGERFRVAGTGGIRIRTGDGSFTDNPDDPMSIGIPSTGGTMEAGNTIPFGLGVAFAVKPQKFEIVGELIGAVNLDGENYQPLEALAGLKVYLARNSFLSLGAGAGLVPDKGGNPDWRAFLGIIFEPNLGDRDGDGYKDDVDECPDDPEDFDDFEDEDGCPDPDNDRDGILDKDDECPNTPEDKDGFEDEDGCPEGNEFDRDGDGILDSEDECPDDPEDFDDFEDKDGCPDPDNDQDGILDVDDLCPNEPEDKDGFEDADGCPDPDNDSDRILDEDDQCPRKDGETREETAEVYNGKDDEDGCPDRGRVIVTDTKIEILDKIYFEYDSDIIKKVSYPILDAIVATLVGNPDIALIEIQGHTDERGSDAYNLDLSDRRAASVRRYIINGGIEEGRMQSQGYGETQPVSPKHNEKAWAQNRRVEFLIIKRASQ